MEYTKTAIFEYNGFAKKRYAVMLYSICGLLLALVGLYIIWLQHSDIAVFVALNQFLTHVGTQINQATFLGILYASTFGGLFFVTVPLEAIFIRFLNSGVSAAFLITFYLLGLIISYSLNYYIGLKLNTLCQKLISPKKFYKIKGVLNRRGVLAIFVFNVLPLPSQPLSTILGVFKYNKAKFYLYFILGQLVKYVVISTVLLLVL